MSRNFDSASICNIMAVKLNYVFPALHGNMGNYYFTIGKLDSALIEYGIAINQNPDSYEPYLNRALTFQNLKKYPEALKDYNSAAELNPELGKIFYNRSYCYSLMGNKQMALQDINKAKQLGFSQIDPAYYNQLTK